MIKPGPKNEDGTTVYLVHGFTQVGQERFTEERVNIINKPLQVGDTFEVQIKRDDEGGINVLYQTGGCRCEELDEEDEGYYDECDHGETSIRFSPDRWDDALSWIARRMKLEPGTDIPVLERHEKLTMKNFECSRSVTDDWYMHTITEEN